VSYPETRGMRVVVTSGRVAIKASATNVVAPNDTSSRTLATLGRGDLAWLDTSGALRVQRDVDVKQYVSWSTGTLVFNGTPLKEALAVLARWYSVEFRLADSSLATRPLTATF